MGNLRDVVVFSQISLAAIIHRWLQVANVCSFFLHDVLFLHVNALGVAAPVVIVFAAPVVFKF